jgi:hypothetical protein
MVLEPRLRINHRAEAIDSRLQQLLDRLTGGLIVAHGRAFLRELARGAQSGVG